MAYMDNKAVPRRAPNSPDLPDGNVASSGSNQEMSQPQTSKFRTVSLTAKPGVNIGTLVQTQASNKGTGIVGRPSSFGESIKDTSNPATSNPSGTRNQTSARYSGK